MHNFYAYIYLWEYRSRYVNIREDVTHKNMDLAEVNLIINTIFAAISGQFISYGHIQWLLDTIVMVSLP